MTILKSYKGLELIKLSSPVKSGYYAVRYKKERKAKIAQTLDEAIDIFYNCIK